MINVESYREWGVEMIRVVYLVSTLRTTALGITIYFTIYFTLWLWHFILRHRKYFTDGLKWKFYSSKIRDTTYIMGQLADVGEGKARDERERNKNTIQIYQFVGYMTSKKKNAEQVIKAANTEQVIKQLQFITSCKGQKSCFPL